MIIQQISVFVENKSGKLHEVAAVLAGENVNIRALSLADSASFGVLRMIVDKTDIAYKALKAAGLTVKISEVVAIEVPDKVGGFAEVMKVMNDAGINVEYMYAFVEKNQDNAILIFRFDDVRGTLAILKDKGLRMLQAREVQSR
ncbi:MAG: hypothetical protein PHH77_12365 [Victivallaceae bacterium]|nr:hypothetical protein [Victivallaceae bacterium]